MGKEGIGGEGVKERVKEERRRGWRKRKEREQGRIGVQESGKCGD